MLLEPEKYKLGRRGRKKIVREVSPIDKKWSPTLGKYVSPPRLPRPPKIYKWRRYKIGSGFYLRIYPDGTREITRSHGFVVWGKGRKFIPELLNMNYCYLDPKMIKRQKVAINKK